MPLVSKYELVTAGTKVDHSFPAIPSGKTFVVCCIDMTCPTSADAGVLVYYDGFAMGKVRAAAQADKSVQIKAPGIQLQGDGVKTIDVRLDNRLGSSNALLGVTIYYED